jgi:hypothetical protein
VRVVCWWIVYQEKDAGGGTGVEGEPDSWQALPSITPAYPRTVSHSPEQAGLPNVAIVDF